MDDLDGWYFCPRCQQRYDVADVMAFAEAHMRECVVGMAWAKDPSTWEVVLIRCPECGDTVVATAGEQHQADHFLHPDGRR